MPIYWKHQQRLLRLNGQTKMVEKEMESKNYGGYEAHEMPTKKMTSKIPTSAGVIRNRA